MKLIIFFLLSILVLGCEQEKQNGNFEEAPIEEISSFLNQKEVENADFTNDRFLLDQSYYKGKIKLYLYQNNRFHYDLENLGEGDGDWIVNNGKIELESFAGWIPLRFWIFKDQQGKHYLKFLDSDGVKVHKAKWVNQESSQ